MLCGFMALYKYYGLLVPGLNFVKTSLTYFYSLLISSSALHLIAERLASVTADTSFKVFGLTRLRMEPGLPASKANALNHYRKQKSVSCIFIHLSRESDQSAIRTRLGVAGHLSTAPGWGNPAKCLSQRHNK